MNTIPVSWVPENLEIGAMFGLITGANNFPGLISLTCEHDHTVVGFSINNQESLLAVTFPNLESIYGEGALFGFTNNTVLGVISAPWFSSFPKGAVFNVVNNPALRVLDVSALETIPCNVTVTGNTTLQNFSAPLWLPTNGKNINFSGNALSQATVDHILARAVANTAYVSGTINLSGGTNAAPGTQGQTDKTTLQARGVTVTTN